MNTKHGETVITNRIFSHYNDVWLDNDVWFSYLIPCFGHTEKNNFIAWQFECDACDQKKKKKKKASVKIKII